MVLVQSFTDFHRVKSSLPRMQLDVFTAPQAVTCVLCRATVSVRKGDKARFFNHISHDHEVHYDMELFYVLSYLGDTQREAAVTIINQRFVNNEDDSSTVTEEEKENDDPTLDEAVADIVEVIEQPEVELSLPSTESLDPCEREVEGVSSENLISDISKKNYDQTKRLEAQVSDTSNIVHKLVEKTFLIAISYNSYSVYSITCC